MLAGRLETTIEQLLDIIERLETAGKDLNEEATKRILIVPLLSALGWNFQDPFEVESEYKVQTTRLDYALFIDAEPRLFVETKRGRKSLQDTSAIMQTLNYANTSKVKWCILTNGIVYDLYLTHAVADISRKLLLHIDIKEARNDLSMIANNLKLMSKETLASGALDEWGEETYWDMRIEGAIEDLAAKPPAEVIEVLARHLQVPKADYGKVEASLIRLWSGTFPTRPVPSLTASLAVSGSSATPDSTTTYTIETHCEDKPAWIRIAFDALDKYTRERGGDTSRRVNKHTITYSCSSKAFVSIGVKKSYLIVEVNLDRSQLPTGLTAQVRNIHGLGSQGIGGNRYELKSSDLSEVSQLVDLAYAYAHRA